MYLSKNSPFAALALFTLIGACQSFGPELADIGELTQSGKEISGEVQWGFAAMQGDEVEVSLNEDRGSLHSITLVPTPGVQHIKFTMRVSHNDQTACQAGGSCRYEAVLKNAEQIKAKGFIYYSPTSHPMLVLDPAGMVSVPGQENTQFVELPKPVYR